MKLSQNFSLAELEKSQTATRNGINNAAPAVDIPKLKALAENVLQPVRDKWGPVIISSGYRSPDLNKVIGGSNTSQHTLCEAADFEVRGESNLKIARWIEETLDFDQLILEFYVPGEPNSGWIHCSYKKEGNRKQTLTASRVDGRVQYTAGLG